MTFPLYPRENSPGREPTMWWLGGSRERYGSALFVSRDRDGGFTLFRSNRPYGVNDRLGAVSGLDLTEVEVDAVMQAEHDRRWRPTGHA
jgi:hypothetical protein